MLVTILSVPEIFPTIADGLCCGIGIESGNRVKIGIGIGLLLVVGGLCCCQHTHYSCTCVSPAAQVSATNAVDAAVAVDSIRYSINDQTWLTSQNPQSALNLMVVGSAGHYRVLAFGQTQVSDTLRFTIVNNNDPNCPNVITKSVAIHFGTNHTNSATVTDFGSCGS